jgi:hypothetical protein
MSSTGFISTASVPSSSLGEQRRESQAAMRSHPGANEGVRMGVGRVMTVSDDKLAVTVVDRHGGYLGSNNPIPLAHSSQEIVSRFGTVRPGMICVVFYTGVDGGDAIAFLIGNEGETPENTPLQPNTVALGPYRIFAPGIGL